MRVSSSEEAPFLCAPCMENSLAVKVRCAPGSRER